MKIRFKDLVFKDYLAKWEEQAIVDFNNGYGVSIGKADTNLYDVIVFKNDSSYFDTIIEKEEHLNCLRSKVDLILNRIQNI